jgi:hypothetical protein
MPLYIIIYELVDSFIGYSLFPAVTSVIKLILPSSIYIPGYFMGVFASKRKSIRRSDTHMLLTLSTHWRPALIEIQHASEDIAKLPLEILKRTPFKKNLGRVTDKYVFNTLQNTYKPKL